MQCACVLLPYVACPTLQYFSTLSHKRHDFRKKLLPNIKCVFSFSLQLLSQTFFTLRKTERDVIVNVYWSLCKVPFILVRFQCKLNFLDLFSKKKRNIFRENPSSGRKVFRRKRTGRRIDMSKLVITFEIWRNHLTMA